MSLVGLTPRKRLARDLELLLGLGPLVGVPLNLGAFVSVPSVIPVTPVPISPSINGSVFRVACEGDA